MYKCYSHVYSNTMTFELIYDVSLMDCLVYYSLGLIAYYVLDQFEIDIRPEVNRCSDFDTKSYMILY